MGDKKGTITSLTNSYTDEETDVTVVKVWDDTNNNDRKRPESLSVDLMDGETVIIWVMKIFLYTSVFSCHLFFFFFNLILFLNFTILY